ncbi:hypothetical protein BC937DRAFT_94965 [Endogone sp. FLAS-F59071]|nr:hypothetical protein BC937DRAFT_94965 [Endogone sp. FLAS-F59071]|eukprot:RUS13664.1 hypothetical protein BC937DRAFT_94965 [Endogone sp. FLAS-F59071]
MIQGNLQFLYYTSYSLNATNPSITKLVIVVHGIERNAIDYFNIVQSIANSASIISTTAIVAPYFECAADNPPDLHVRWLASGPH